MAEKGGLDMTAALSDGEIVRQVLEEDPRRFELIMRRNNRRLYRIARGLLQSDADAEDAVQDAYVHAYQKLGEYQGTGPLSAWLAKITVNVALGRLRRAEPAGEGVSFDDPIRSEEANYMAQLSNTPPSPELLAARGEMRRILENAIDALPEAYRMAFIMCGVEEMSVAETAQCLGVEQNTVKTRYHRAKKILQQQLLELLDTSAVDAFSFDGVRCDRIVHKVLLRLEIGCREGRSQ
ncbi:RNA polymerase sigma factor [Geomonas limicola]|uniref:RNA polymerase sigma factor n=1 Tax=Geomonas limicola TaxID=2740186 RepID=A0A6V8N290_9BACT|nr:RNA polymerase sigma factor [Geomonas limicola]GFO66655.1 RNA polymerase sigma factor [Geomonas limicola]